MTHPTPWRSACGLARRRFSDADAIRFGGAGHGVDGSNQSRLASLEAPCTQLRRARFDPPEAMPP